MSHEVYTSYKIRLRIAETSGSKKQQSSERWLHQSLSFVLKSEPKVNSMEVPTPDTF